MIGSSAASKLKQQYTADLDEAKRELNAVSETSSVSRIRASRSLYHLDRLRERCEDELRHQSRDKDKVIHTDVYLNCFFTIIEWYIRS